MKAMILILQSLIISGLAAVSDLGGEGISGAVQIGKAGVMISGSAAAVTGNIWTLVQSKSASNGSLTLDAVPTPGNLLVVGIKTEGSATGLGATCGTDVFTLGNLSNGAGGDLHCCFAYLLASTQQATGVVLVGGVLSFEVIFVREYSAAGVHSLDAQGVSASGNSASVASAVATSSVTRGLALGFYGEYTATVASAEKIGSNNASSIVTQGNTVFWDYNFTSTLNSVTANCTIAPASEWVSSLAIFKSQ